MENGNEPAAFMVPITELNEWEKNPRVNEAAVDKVAASIRRFGFGAPIVARKEDRVIIAGHTRIKAARTIEGMTHVPVRYLDISIREAEALALADNKLGEIAVWEDNMLAALLADLSEEEAVSLGFNEEELEDLLRDIDDEKEEEEYNLNDYDFTKAVSKEGEIYQLGPHVLICGDCRNEEDVKRLLGDKKINVAITSPPYASQRKYDETTKFKPIRPDDYIEWFSDVQRNIERYLCEDGSFFLNIKEHCEDGQRVLYVKKLVIEAVDNWKWRFVDEYIWTHSGTPKQVLKRFKNGFESIFFFSKGEYKFRPKNVMHKTKQKNLVENAWGGSGLHPNDEKIQKHGWKEGKKRFNLKQPISNSSGQGKKGFSKIVSQCIIDNSDGYAYPSNCLSFGKNKEALGHPAAYPTKLPSFFIKAYSDEKDIIYDPFLGSGSTLIASAINERICYGCEISPYYCDIIRMRWSKYADDNNIDRGSGGLDYGDKS